MMQDKITNVNIEHEIFKWEGQTHLCTNITYLRNGNKNSARYIGHWKLPMVKLELGSTD